MKWMRPQSNFFTRKLLCKVFALGFCFSSALDASALTQAEVEQAVYSALTSAPLNMSGAQINVVPWLYPSIQTMTFGEYLLYALGWQATYQQPDTLRSLLRDISANTRTNSTDLSTVLPFLESLSSNQVTDGQFVDQMTHLEWNYLDNLTHLTFTGDDRLRVQDEDLFWMASNINANVESSSYVIAGGVASLGVEIIPYLEDILDHMDKFKETDEEVPEIVEDAESGATSDYDDQWDQVESEYDSLDDPTLSEDEYDEVYTPTDDPTTSDIFEDVSTSVSHSALLTLVHPIRSRSTTTLPGIEVDFGRDSGFSSFCLRLNDLTDWLYPVCGLLFLSFKGVRMWRIVRTATVASTADPGSPPIVHLAWDPF